MSIITISRGSFSGGQEFAKKLAKKLGYTCLSREQLSEKAIDAGVPISKLQTAMIRPPRIAKRLGPERDFCLASVTSILCDYILEGNLVYHGHTGHMLLPGIPNIFRVRVLADMQYRLSAVMDKLNISREKAQQYIESVDGDRDKWVRFLYGIDWSLPAQYDVVVNLAQLSTDNAATAMCSMAELPDFKLTPASIKAVKNLKLASSARFLLLKDKRTNFADFKVTADNGVVQVICMPHQAEVAQYVQEILGGLENCQSVHCTIAGSNILWLGEEFTTDSEIFRNLIRVAKKWDAAVEIMRYAAEDKEKTEPAFTPFKTMMSMQNGGIEDDTEETAAEDSSGVHQVLDGLLKEGCSGGSSTIYGDKENLINNIAQHTHYSLVVIGNMFMSKTDSIRKRLTSELRSLLLDHMKSPVIGVEELKRELKTGIREYFRLAFLLIFVVTVFVSVFTNQERVTTFMAGEYYKSWRILAVLLLLLLVPAFAYCYGTSARHVFKFFKLD